MTSDQEWFDWLHASFFGDVRRYIRRRVRDDQLAEDLAQETFLRAYRARHSFDQDRPPWPWLKAISKNLLINSARDHARRPQTTSDVADDHSEAAEVSPEAIPELSYDSAERRTLIHLTLRELSDRERRALLLRYEGQLAYEDIAKVEGLTRDALKSLLKRARQRFRNAYTRHGGDLPAVIGAPLVALRFRKRLLARYAPTMTNPLMATTEVVVAVFLVATSAVGSVSAISATEQRPSASVSSAQHVAEIERTHDRANGGVADQPALADRSARDQDAPVDVGISTGLTDEQNGAMIEITREEHPPGRSRGKGSKTEVQVLCLDNPDESVCSVIPQGIGK